jgi:hypothetical protein
LKTACREGFTTFITKAGVQNRPRVVACGSRLDAYKSFCTALANGEAALLLVDSESAIDANHQHGPADTWKAWAHLKSRVGDEWDKPPGAAGVECHLMVQVMESWFLADRATLIAFFGHGFRHNALPAAGRPIEEIAKLEVYDALKKATSNCKTKIEYSKGEHSFKLLTKLDPAKVTQASPWANRFVAGIRKMMDGV